MHTGRSNDGRLLYPAFPFRATRRSRAPTPTPSSRTCARCRRSRADRPHELRFPFNNRNLLIGWRTLFFREGEYKPDPTKSVEWNRGAYLVDGLGHCGMCHTAINAFGGPDSSTAFAGGLIPLQNWYAPSLTSNKEAGLGDWDIKDIADLLKTGVSQRGAVFGPMAEVVHNSLQYMSDDDIHAMATFLKSIPQKNEAPESLQRRRRRSSAPSCCSKARRSTRTTAPSATRKTAWAMPPSFPPLASNQSILMQSAVNPIRMVLNGGLSADHRRQPAAVRHAAVRAIFVESGSRGRRDLYPYVVGHVARRCHRNKDRFAFGTARLSSVRCTWGAACGNRGRALRFCRTGIM